jgi:SAM-dependent methyltransferase
LPDDYVSAFRSEHAAARYDDTTYDPQSYDSFIGALQAHWLRQFVAAEFPDEEPALHDFACGTGRILEALAGAVIEAHGYDVSADMLAAAARKGLPAQLHLVQARPTPVSLDGPPGRPLLVTMFRLLLNAPDQVRRDSLRFAADLLRQTEHGVLVVNNHGNRWSLRSLRRLRPLTDGEWFHSLSTRDVRRLTGEHGLAVRRRYGFGLVPRGLHATPARALARRVDRWAAGQRWLAPVSIDIAYVVTPAPRDS